MVVARGQRYDGSSYSRLLINLLLKTSPLLAELIRALGTANELFPFV